MGGRGFHLEHLSISLCSVSVKSRRSKRKGWLWAQPRLANLVWRSCFTTSRVFQLGKQRKLKSNGFPTHKNKKKLELLLHRKVSKLCIFLVVTYLRPLFHIFLWNSNPFSTLPLHVVTRVLAPVWPRTVVKWRRGTSLSCDHVQWSSGEGVRVCHSFTKKMWKREPR